jgi:homoserine O-acetyltransferase/O-succinyltransferase
MSVSRSGSGRLARASGGAATAGIPLARRAAAGTVPRGGSVRARSAYTARTVIDAIRNDPAWQGGEYRTQPPSLRTAAEMLWLTGSNPVLRQQEAPTREKADGAIDAFVARYLESGDANDVLYALEASADYDPGPALEKIRAPLLAINTADDLINPPELGILERDVKRVPRGHAVVLPLSERTRGHGSHTMAAL